MLVTTQTALALQCSYCEKLTLHTLSRFNLNSDKGIQVSCDCGEELITISRLRRKDKEQYQLALTCPICEVNHSYVLSGKAMWSNGCIPLTCENTDVEIGFIGDAEEVDKCVQRLDRSLREIAEEFGYDKYFINADIMYQVLEAVREKLDGGEVSCSCGKEQLKPEICPDRIELVCSHCGATGIVFAETSKDLQTAQELTKIQLEANSYQYLDRKYLIRKTRLKE